MWPLSLQQIIFFRSPVSMGRYHKRKPDTDNRGPLKNEQSTSKSTPAEVAKVNRLHSDS